MPSALLFAIAALPFLGADALTRSTTGRCGLQSLNLLTCKASAFGNCCSTSGYCGASSAYCGKGCQVGFGDCTSSVSTSAKSSSASVKPSSTKVTVVSVKPSSASSTLSTVTSSRIPTTSPLPSKQSSAAPFASPSSIPVKVSTDGSCGGTQGFTCLGSSIGDCCSEYGWCGSTSLYCDAGCNAAFGKCNGASVSVKPSSSSGPARSSSSAVPSFTTSTKTTSAAPSSTQGVSIDGQCGASSNGLTCLGSQLGDCCSQYGYCGSTAAFCGTGCQSPFGKCETVPAPGNTCGVEGFANKEEYYASSFNLVDATDVSTCATLCLAEAACMSYLFNPKLGNCAYLPYTLEQGEFIASTGTDQLFWDRACAEATKA